MSNTKDNRLYAYSYFKEKAWVEKKVKQIQKVDHRMSNTKVICALILEKMQDENHKEWDPRTVLTKLESRKSRARKPKVKAN